MSFLLILIIFLFFFFFFLIHNVVAVLFQWLYLRNYYFLLAWAAQSVFPIVANVPSETAGQEAACWEAPTSSLRLSGRHDMERSWASAKCGAAVPPVPSSGPSLQQSLSITAADTEPCGGAVLTQGREAGHLVAKSAWPCQTGVGNYPFISMSFCLLGICTTHVVSVCFIYL